MHENHILRRELFGLVDPLRVLQLVVVHDLVEIDAGDTFLSDDEGRATRIPFGARGDVPLPGDYNLTGRAQLAVYRPATGEWFVRDDGGDVRRYEWGAPGDLPVPARYEHRFGLDIP